MYRSRTPVWSFIKYAKAGTFAWTALTGADLPRVFNALAGYEGMNWCQIETKPHCHVMEVSVCHRDIGEYLTNQGLDIDSLFQLSTGNKGRIFGVRIEHVFQIIFWDCDHQGFKTEKKNT